MPNNPLFRTQNSPKNVTRPSKAVNETSTTVKLTHNTFDNSYFNFKTQRFGLYEPFWWKNTVAGDNEPFSNSHNVRSLPFASPILSPMKINKDYFQVPHYAIQPNTWDYIFKTPTQGDDVPADAQNLFPLFSLVSGTTNQPISFSEVVDFMLDNLSATDDPDIFSGGVFKLFMLETFLSSGSLPYQCGFKLNPLFPAAGSGDPMTFDELFDKVISDCELDVTINVPNADSPTDFTSVSFSTNTLGSVIVDKFTFCSIVRQFAPYITSFEATPSGDLGYIASLSFQGLPTLVNESGSFATAIREGINCMRMDVINAYQLACAQYYVNPRVDPIYNAQLYRDNWISLLRDLASSAESSAFSSIDTFSYNGIPVLYDFFSLHYYERFVQIFLNEVVTNPDPTDVMYKCYAILQYLFGFRESLKFGDYFTDSRTQALGYGDPGSDVVSVFDDGVSVTDLSQKLVLNRYRTAVAHLDNSSEDYLATMFHEQLPPDYHYPKFIAHSEFGVDGSEVSNTTSDNQGNIVTNLMSGNDTAEFNIEVSVPSILVGISYFSIPRVYSQIKERSYFHEDRYDMFQPMLQYLGDQEIYNREKSDTLENPMDSYGYVSRNGEYKQRVSQCSGAFLTSLRSWLFVDDALTGEGKTIVPVYQQNAVAIRAHDWEFNRFLKAVSGVSLGTGFHFIMQYNNKNVDNRPMEVNPLPLYPNNSL